MTDVTTTRKQRLRMLENEIRSGMEQFYVVGMRLKEIRDDELYQADGFATWEAYCKGRWEWTKDYCNKLMRAADYRKALPDTNCIRDQGAGWNEGTVRELTRIPDKRQATRVAQKVVKAVEQSEK